MRLSRSILFAGALVLAYAASAQSGKGFFKEAEKLRADGQLDQAVEKYTLAVQVDPKFLKAYASRAEVYALLGRKAECAADRRKVAELDPSEPLFASDAAKAYLDMDDATTAITLCDQALRTDAKCMPALQTKVRACLLANDLDKATATADAALAQKATTETYYLHGLARMATRDFKTAEFDFDKVVEWNPLYEAAYVGQAETQLLLYQQYSGLTMQMRTLEKAIDKCTRALELNPMSTDALFTRSKAYGLQKEYSKAIDDVSHVISLGRETSEVLYQRAVYYHGFGQHQNAVNDLNKLLLNDPKNMRAVLLRAECKEANVDLEGARKDLETVQRAAERDPSFTAQDRHEMSEHKTRLDQLIFEQNRESDPPVVTIVEPYRKNGDVVQVGSALQQVKVNGHVRDRNLLKRITVNGADADYAKDEKDPEFFISIPLGAAVKTIDVEATDLYDNVATVTMHVERTESTPPTLALVSPRAEDRTISIEAGKEDVFIEGNASDASGVRSITVDGVQASFVPDTTATDFSIKVPLGSKERITVRAEDQFGNASELSYFIKRKAAAVAVVTPAEKPTTEKPATEKPNNERPTNSATGNTWVVLIQNADYKSFPAPQGQGNDLSEIQRSFGRYNAQRTITKRNMTKSQIERFFNIELRDLVRTNKVNTILVGYVGHGRSAAGRTYWVPVDGKKDDIYSYYNYGSLKSLLENYSESVTNTLVVSKAAGTDPSFYELTR